MGYNDDDNVKFDGKYGRVPYGYVLDFFDDDYGLVGYKGWKQDYRLINSKGEFITDQCAWIEPTGNNCYICWNEGEVKIIDSGETKSILKGHYDRTRFVSRFSNLGDGLFKLYNCDKGYNSVIDKDKGVIIEEVSDAMYSDGKIFFTKPKDNTLYIASKNGETVDSFEVGFRFFIDEHKGGNCLIWNLNQGPNYRNFGTFYGVNLQNKELIEIYGNLMVPGLTKGGRFEALTDDYYVFRHNKDEETIYDSNFKIVKGHIHINNHTSVCRINDEYYSLWNNKEEEHCIMDFDDNILFDHVKKIKDGVMQIGDDRLYDSVNKREISIPLGWKVISWNRTIENNSLIAFCYDFDSISWHVTDFDTFDVNGRDWDMQSDIKYGFEPNILLGNKYVVIKNRIIPVGDLKTIGDDYEHGKTLVKKMD